ncbi:MAG: peptidase T [Bacteroidota bacterium]|nr:peptidase T [Bacteroidota bacterium]
MKRVKEKFLRYIKIDTQSNPESNTHPSTNEQFDLATKLKTELEAMDLKNVSLSDKCYLTATLPGNIGKKNVPIVGFIAHMDTAPDLSGANVIAQRIENYNGTPILLNEEKQIFLSPEDFPELKNYIGQELLTTDGTTLLGADDKAGIAEIMTALEYLSENPEIKHGDIKIAFTPDEEIGQGADYFDVKKFNADFAYTLDGGEIGELEYENFNAAKLKVKINGRNVHPGTAKNQMINAIEVAMEFNRRLPEKAKPEHTTGYEGFFHLMKIGGTVETAELDYIIRDHDMELFKEKKKLIESLVVNFNEKYPQDTVSIEMQDQYYNMHEKIKPVMHIVDIAEQAIKDAGVTPKIKPIRGGTDGSRLSYMGLPCPNIFAGGHNFHGRYEFIPVNSMEKAAEVIVNITKLIAEKDSVS